MSRSSGKFFGQQRQRGRVNENPFANELVKTLKRFESFVLYVEKLKATVEVEQLLMRHIPIPTKETKERH